MKTTQIKSPARLENKNEKEMQYSTEEKSIYFFNRYMLFSSSLLHNPINVANLLFALSLEHQRTASRNSIYIKTQIKTEEIPEEQEHAKPANISYLAT